MALNSERIYLDHSATTPMDQQVLEVMLPFLNEKFGNASSIHSFGQEAKVAIEQGRRQVAKMLGAEPGEIVLTSGGTESNNWVIKGAASFFDTKKKHLITAVAEHHAVLSTCRFLEQKGLDVTYLGVDKFGMVSPQAVAEALRDDTFLVSIMHANNEVGTLNPVAEIGSIVKNSGVLFHTDAVQTVGHLPIDVKRMNVDFLSLSGHKIYGPKGIGALYVRQGLQIDKLLHGGKHERDRRSGTENVPAIVGLGKAVELCSQSQADETASLARLRDSLESKILESIEDVHINGHPSNRHPGILNISFGGVPSDSMLLSLDLQGIAVSNGSACTSGTIETSHVLQAMGLDRERAASAIRFSFGRQNTTEDIERTLGVLCEIVGRLRKLGRRR